MTYMGISRMEAAAPAARPTHEQIAILAYEFWVGRGCPDGCPEEDWARAESALCRQQDHDLVPAELGTDQQNE